MQIVTERITLTSTTTPSTPSSPPAYALGLTYVRSTSGGKSLLGRGRTKGERGYNAFFDERGVMDQVAFERWVLRGADVRRQPCFSEETDNRAAYGARA